MNKSKLEFTSKRQSNINRKISLKSRILKFLFDFNNNHNNNNMGESIECGKSNKNEPIRSIHCIENEITESNHNYNNNNNDNNNNNNHHNNDIYNNNIDENDEFISYKNIKCIFDEIDRKFGGTLYSEQNTNINNLRNCEMRSPISETSDYSQEEDGEYDDNSLPVPIWEYNQHTSSLSFCVRVEANSDLKGESSFVLINISDLYIFHDTDTTKEEQQRYYDGDFEIL